MAIGGIRVLVADGNREWRAIISRTLTPECQVVGQVDRGDDLLAAANLLQPDVITLEVSMPGCSGLRDLPAIRAAMRDVIIIVISVTLTPIYIEEALSRGADSYIAKSHVLAELMPAIIAGRRQAEQLG